MTREPKIALAGLAITGAAILIWLMSSHKTHDVPPATPPEVSSHLADLQRKHELLVDSYVSEVSKRTTVPAERLRDIGSSKPLDESWSKLPRRVTAENLARMFTWTPDMIEARDLARQELLNWSDHRVADAELGELASLVSWHVTRLKPLMDNYRQTRDRETIATIEAGELTPRESKKLGPRSMEAALGAVRALYPSLPERELERLVRDVPTSADSPLGYIVHKGKTYHFPLGSLPLSDRLLADTAALSTYFALDVVAWFVDKGLARSADADSILEHIFGFDVKQLRKSR